MRFALWLIGLFAVATAVALFAGSDPGTVTVFWPPYRIDLSLNLALLLLLVAFLLLYLAFRALSKLFALPRQAEQWRVQHRARAQHAALLDAWGQLNAGQPGRAATAARAVLTQLAAAPPRSGHAADDDEAVLQRARLRTVAHWLLAQSAQHRGHLPERDQQLTAAITAAEAGAPGAWRDAALLGAAEWALDQLPPRAADPWLDRLPPASARRLQARRLRLRTAVVDGRTLDALVGARQLARRGLLPDAQACRSRLASTHLNAAGNDKAALRRAWDELDATERAWPEVAALAAGRQRRIGDEGLTARQ